MEIAARDAADRRARRAAWAWRGAIVVPVALAAVNALRVLVAG